MGTAVERLTDLLTFLPKRNVVDAPKNFVNNTLITSGLFQESMDRVLEQYNRESMRITMLKHEEIFKEQVRELHRVYRVQKMLMAELRNNEPRLQARSNPSPQAKRDESNCIPIDSPTTYWSVGTTSDTNHFSNKTNQGYNIHQLCSFRPNPNTWEQSTSCTKDTSKMLMGIDLEQPAEEGIGAIEDQAESNSIRSLKDKVSPCLFTDGDNEVELTLSIGFGTSTKKSKSHRSHSSVESGSNERIQKDPVMSIRSDRGEECHDPSKSSSTAKQPPWLFQTLSLNRT